MKISRFLLTTSITLAMAFTHSYSSSGESYAADRGCRWNYELQHSWSMGNYKQVRANAAAEAHLNPNCAEVIWEARQIENGQKKTSGESYAADRGCRWSYNLQHGGWASERDRANAMVESLSNPNCAEIILEAKQIEKEEKEMENEQRKQSEQIRRERKDGEYSSLESSYYSFYAPNGSLFVEIGYQRIEDMNHIRLAYGPFYGTIGVNSGESDILNTPEIDYEKAIEWIIGIIYRQVNNSTKIGFGFFGGLGAKHSGYELQKNDYRYTDMRHELGTEFIFSVFSLYIAERNFHRVGGGVGLIF